MLKRIILIALVLVFVNTIFAQENLSWKKHRKLAEEYYEKGDFGNAAENFEKAWRKKPGKKELIYQAGDSYNQVNDYRKAAEAFKNVKDDNDRFPLVGLKYARTLKQDGQYDKAIEEFRRFVDAYSGEGKVTLQDIVQTEIQGCELAKELPIQMDRSIEITHTGLGVNSDAAEFAPFPMSEMLMFFSSAKGGKARIYSTQRLGNEWSKASIPGNFPVISSGHFCNGAMAPDGERFYFTICNDDRAWNDINTRCELFFIKKMGTSWSEPQRLPDYINQKGITSTHPNVVHLSGEEVIYFASNRPGGRGGLDIWFISRDRGLDNIDFTFPENLGPAVNTLGDEITPFFDPTEQALYFSSNGHPSVGGFDVFKSNGGEMNWSLAQNAGLPVNSGADDHHFIYQNSDATGFFVSNRVFGGQKTTTTNSDIFEFSRGNTRIMLESGVFDANSMAGIGGFKISLFQVFDDQTENLLIEEYFDNSQYAFELLPNRTFKVVIRANGYKAGAYQFSTNDPGTFSYGQALYLEPEAFEPERTTYNPPPTVDVETRTPNPPNPPEVNNTTGTPIPTGRRYIARGTSAQDKLEYSSSAPRFEGIYYRIQLVAVGKFNPDSKSLKSVIRHGELETEKLTNKNLTRVLLGLFFDEEEAKNVLYQVQPGFSGAYVVKYEDGVRYGRVNLK